MVLSLVRLIVSELPSATQSSLPAYRLNITSGHKP